ncbi:MAG: hypothetical protein MHPSP_002833 [Paramarteilia canceri]
MLFAFYCHCNENIGTCYHIRLKPSLEIKCPYKMDNKQECKCDSNDGVSVTIGTDNFCYEAGCTENIDSCVSKNGTFGFEADNNCPNCIEKDEECESGSKVVNCGCIDPKKTYELNDIEYCFSEDCINNISECKAQNGQLSIENNENCPVCKIDDPIEPKKPNKYVGIIFAVIFAVIVILVAIILLAIYSTKDKESVSLVQPVNDKAEPDFFINNEHYNIIPKSGDNSMD